jgi:hypothetical protein
LHRCEPFAFQAFIKYFIKFDANCVSPRHSTTRNAQALR